MPLSIKTVLPITAPGLAYKQNDEIQNGILAQSAYLEVILLDNTTKQRDDLSLKMHEYCKLDTLVMVELV